MNELVHRLSPENSTTDETMADYWRDVKPAMHEASQQRRAANRLSSAEMLRANGVEFESKNDGAHLIVRDCAGCVFDFWPGTGLWKMRGARLQRRGVRALLKIVRQKPSTTPP